MRVSMIRFRAQLLALFPRPADYRFISGTPFYFIDTGDLLAISRGDFAETACRAGYAY